MPASRKTSRGKKEKNPDAEQVQYTAAEVEQIVQERLAGLQRELADLRQADRERTQVEDALRESEEKYRGLGVQPPQTLVIMQDGRIVFVNRWAVEYGGYPKEELLAMSSEEVLQLFHPEDRLMIARCIRERLVRTDVPTRHEVRFIRRDGKVLWGDVFVNLVQYKGRPAYQILFVDITERKRVEEALRESEEKARMLIHGSRDGIVLNDEEGVILEWNPGMERITGFPKEKVVGRTLPEIASWLLLDGEREEDIERRFHALIERLNQPAPDLSENPFVEAAIRRPDGSSRCIQTQGFRFTSGGRILYGAVNRDITEQKKAEVVLKEREEQLLNLIESSGDGIIITDEEGRITTWNRGMETISGLAAREVLGRPAWEVQSRIVNTAWMGPDYQQRFRAMWDRVLRGGSQYPPRLLEVQVRTPQGEIRYLQQSVFSIATQEGHRIGCIMRDITENKRAEMQLTEYASNLKRSNEDLELFAQIAAHDLQEPIRGIVTFSQILLDQLRAGAPLTEKYLKNIEDAGLRMNRLVSDLRRYSVVRAHERPQEPTDMERVLSSALENLQLAIRESQAQVTHDPLPSALADGSQMIQVFQNLIDNAIKFRQDGVPPAIHVSASPVDGMWQFSIRDNGIGIQPEYFDKIFVLFERLHRRGAYPGTGLGLALCRRIIDRHGGRIWVTSESGKGSTFHFTLMPVK